MKLYTPEPKLLVRLQITQQKEETQYLTFCETTKEELEVFLMDLITDQHLSIFTQGAKTSINIRDAVGGKNGKSKALSFRGLTPKQLVELITKKLTTE